MEKEWTKEEIEWINKTELTELSWGEIENHLPDKSIRQIIKMMHYIEKTEFKKGRIHWRENGPPSVVTSANEPNLDLMAKAIFNLYYQTKDYKKGSLNEKEN